MKNFNYFFILLLCLCFNFSSAQLNTDLLAEMDFSLNLSDVWGYTAPDGTEYALVGVRNGLSIVSLDDPDDPEEVAFIGGDNSIWRDIKTWDEHAYVVADQGNDGMTVIDLSDLPNSVSSSQWTPNIPGLGLLRKCHNLYIDENGKAFLTGCNLNSGGPFVVDVFTDPDNPSFIDVATTTYAHDVFVQDDILYSSEIYAGKISMYDVSDLDDVSLLGSQNTPRNFTHNAWANGDGTLVFTTDEKANAPTAAYDISDYDNIELLDEFRPLASLGSGVIPHNVHFRDDYLIISHYTDGVIIVDAKDPSNLIEVGNYDTWSGGDGGFSGAWGAFPFFDTDKILVSDISNGLFILDATYTRSARIEGKVTDYFSGAELNEVDVEILSNQLNATKTNASGDYKTGQEAEGLFSIQYSKPGYLTHVAEVVLVKGEAVIVDVQLVPLSSVYTASGTITELPGGAPIDGAKVVLQNNDFYFVTTSDENGDFNFPQVVQGEYNLIGGNWGHLQNQTTDNPVFSNTDGLDIELTKGYQDDFVADLGWEIEDFANDGTWSLGEPRGTESNGNQANPDEDIDSDYSDRAYVTGNGGASGNDDDLDGGPARLISPVMDLSIFNQPVIHYNSWFYNDISGSTNDFFDISIDNGSIFSQLESISTSTSGWEARSFDISGLITITDEMTLKCEVADNGTDHLIEAGMDGFWVEEGTPFVDFTSSDTEGCGPHGVQFTDNNNNSVAWNWQFEGGTPANSTEQNPFVIFEDPGTFNVSLQIQTWDGQFHEAEIEDLIHVLDLPTADFSFGIDQRTVAFTNESMNYDITDWDFGDDNSSSQTDPIHEYEEDGTYTVILTVTNECGDAGKIQDVVIETLPTANFYSDTQSGCVPLEVQYENLSSPNSESFMWTFEGGTPETSTEVEPLVTYNEKGIYGTTLIAINEVGNDTIEFENFIGVSDVPIADFTFQVNGSNVSFNNISVDGFTYEWTFGDGNGSDEEHPNYEYEEDGLFEVNLIAFNACGSDTTILYVEISTYPVAEFSSNVQAGCVELSVQYENQSSPNADNFYWEFEGGSPPTSMEENPLVNYSAEGTYGVTLIASNELGSDTITYDTYVEVSDIPTADFSFEISSREVDFENLSINGNNYEWHYGDGEVSLDENTNHEYTEDGVYEVLLIAINACGPDTIVKNVEINTPPKAGFESNIQGGCLPLEIQFTDLSSMNTDLWNWTFEGGSPSESNEQNPVITYDTKGVFSVQLVVSNETGTDTVYEEKLIIINDVPESDFEYEINDFDISLNNLSHNYNSVSWDLGDGTISTEESIEHTYSEEGIYTVILIAENECGLDTHSVMVNASLLPSAGIDMDRDKACLPTAIQFYDGSSANVIEWQWNFEGGIPESSVEQDPLITYESTGTFDVQLIVKSLAGADTILMPDAITINDIPHAEYDFSVNDLNVDFENLSMNYEEVEWFFGDGNMSSELDPKHDYLEDGEYDVLLIATNECGKDSFETRIKIVTLPNADFIENGNWGCIPFVVDYLNNSSPNATHFLWTFEGGNPSSSTDESPSVSYSSTGVFNVMLIASNEAGSDTLYKEKLIVSDDVPQSAFDVEADLLEVNFVNISTNAQSFEWDFGDEQFSNEVSPSHVYDEPGTYEVRLISFNDCGTDTLVISVMVSSTAIYELGLDFDAVLRPNPFVNSFYFDYDLNNIDRGNYEISIFDIYGKKLSNTNLTERKGRLELGENLKPGVYILHLFKDRESLWISKAVKQ